MLYGDVLWMMGVTITNLGYGDFTPSNYISRIIISILSLLGILQTALIVGVLSETLVIPPDEKRILASVDRQKANQIRRHAAAKLIQSTWQKYRFQRTTVDQNNTTKNKPCTITNRLRTSIFKVRESRSLNRRFVDALWQWRRVKTSTDSVGQSLQKEFLIDDTAITTAYISRKLDQLERLVRRGSHEIHLEREREIRARWLRAGRYAIQNITKPKTRNTNVFTITDS